MRMIEHAGMMAAKWQFNNLLQVKGEIKLFFNFDWESFCLITIKFQLPVQLIQPHFSFSSSSSKTFRETSKMRLEFAENLNK